MDSQVVAPRTATFSNRNYGRNGEQAGHEQIVSRLLGDRASCQLLVPGYSQGNTRKPMDTRGTRSLDRSDACGGRPKASVPYCLGPAGVGKSSLYKKIMYDDLTGGSKLLHDEFDPTLEDRSYATYSCGDSQYQIYFRFSTAGHAAGIDCYCSYYSYCGIILVYDLSSPHTWVEAVRLQKLIGGCHPLDKGEKESRPEIKVMLLGLKADIPGGLYVPHAEREAFARKNGALFAECSARTGEWVHEAIRLFVEHAHGVISRHPELSCPGVVNTSQRQLFDSLDEALTAVRKNAVTPRLPEVYCHWRWLELIRDGTLTWKDVDHRGGSMCVAIWGHPSIGKSFLLDMLLYDDMYGIGGQWLPTTTTLRQDSSAGFVCDTHHYDMRIIQSAALYHTSDYYGVVLVYEVSGPETFSELRDLQSYGMRWSRWGEGGIPVQILVLALHDDASILASQDQSQDSQHSRSLTETRRYAEENSILFAECSPRTGEGVHEAFGLLVQHTHTARMRHEGDDGGLEHSKDLARAVFRRLLRVSFRTLRGPRSSAFGVGT
ncbi:hypothetical protein GE09DRAFT_464097, partial [Coniochaeta sp. 2T2.1]